MNKRSPSPANLSTFIEWLHVFQNRQFKIYLGFQFIRRAVKERERDRDCWTQQKCKKRNKDEKKVLLCVRRRRRRRNPGERGRNKKRKVTILHIRGHLNYNKVFFIALFNDGFYSFFLPRCQKGVSFKEHKLNFTFVHYLAKKKKKLNIYRLLLFFKRKGKIYW